MEVFIYLFSSLQDKRDFIYELAILNLFSSLMNSSFFMKLFLHRFFCKRNHLPCCHNGIIRWAPCYMLLQAWELIYSSFVPTHLYKSTNETILNFFNHLDHTTKMEMLQSPLIQHGKNSCILNQSMLVNLRVLNANKLPWGSKRAPSLGLLLLKLCHS